MINRLHVNDSRGKGYTFQEGHLLTPADVQSVEDVAAELSRRYQLDPAVAQAIGVIVFAGGQVQFTTHPGKTAFEFCSFYGTAGWDIVRRLPDLTQGQS